MATKDLEELSKSLDLPLNEQSPDDYIRKTLRAHGLFNHCRAPVRSRRRERPSVRGVISEEDKKRTTQLVSHYREGREFHTLKEPRHLYRHTNGGQLMGDGSPRHPFWPAEVHCIRDRPTLLMTAPKFTEPYHIQEQEVVPPMIRSVERYGKVVYSNLPGPEKFYVRSRCGPSVNLPPAETPPPADITLQFESRFESGNLARAVQVGRWDYELYLRHDLYTKKYTQWYYFRVRNMQAGQTYRFTIVNLYKAGSLFNEGMQLVFYSEREARERKIGWHRAGHNIKYFKTPIKRRDKKQESFCYGMTWSHTFTHSGDTCYFAHSFPYTYSDLQEYLKKVLTHKEKAKFCKYKVLCHTIAGNPVPLLTITSPSLTPDDSQAKRGVVVTARIHPGETNGSWMMKGLLDFLTSSADDAKILRDLFVFKVVPMLNPDGVITGNYRCSLSGRDLNRNYRSTLKDSYPTVWHTRNMVKQFSQEREVVMFCDLHGHSRKHNIFIYGCDALNDPTSRLKSRVFPRMLSKNASDMFSYTSSRFVVQKSKEGTGRVVMWREAGIQNSYTLEATFAGSTQGKLKGVQFSTAHLEDMGYHLCDTLLDYCDPDQSKVENIMQEIQEDYRKSVLAVLAQLGQELPPGVDPLDIEIDPALAEGDSSDAGSDSSESDGPPVHLQWKRHQRNKKKKLKSRKERNKRKALLKMNHNRTLSMPASSVSQPTVSTEAPHHTKRTKPEPKEEKEKKSESIARQQSCDVLGCSHPSSRNGGIPLFVQERLDERQRKREEEDESSTAGVPPDELRQALLRIQATHTLSSTPFIPHPGCPMNISQVNIHEVSRRRGRWNREASLPQLVSGSLVPPELPPLIPASRSSKGGFTSQYVAHHLQHIGAMAQGSLVPPQPTLLNSTRNLGDLSRLFRQLHMPSVAGAGQNQLSHRLRSHQSEETRKHAQSTNKEEPTRETTGSKKETETSPQGKAASFETGLRSNLRTKSSQLQAQDSQDGTVTSNMKISSSEARTENSCYLQMSSGNVSRGSPISSGSSTSSWESFSQEVTLKDRGQQRQTGSERKEIEVTLNDRQQQRETRGEGKGREDTLKDRGQQRQTRGKGGEREKTRKSEPRMAGNKLVLDAELGAGRESAQPHTDNVTTKKEMAGKDHHGRGSEQTSSPVFPHLPPDQRRTAAILTHKQGIISAMENTHTPRLNSPLPHLPRTSEYRDEYRVSTAAPHVSKSKSNPLPTSRLLTPLPNHYTHSHPHMEHSVQHASQGLTEPTAANRGETDALGAVSRAEEVHFRRKSVRKSVEHFDNTRAYYDEMRHVRTGIDPNTPPNTDQQDESLQHRSFSSKPPSRYGPRPGPDDGVPPTRLSIMLGRKPGSRPATIHCSRRKHGKHPHIQYFANKPLN